LIGLKDYIYIYPVMGYNGSVNDGGGKMIKGFDDVFEMARQKKEATVVVAAAGSADSTEAVIGAVRLGIAKVVLVGDETRIKESARALKIDISALLGVEIVDVKDMLEACREAVKMVRDGVAEGKAIALMKGDVDTSALLKVILDRENGLRKGKQLSHIVAFEAPNYHKMLFAADCAVNIDPDFDTKVDIIENTVSALHKLGVACPKVALLAAKEIADEKMPVTMEWERLIKLHKSGERMKDCVVDGPFALDNAVSREACEIKGVESIVGGDADILICPNIEAGNVLYKCLSFIAKAKNGGVIVGAKSPIVLTSRSDSAESKLFSIALAVLL
jgi:phosphate butyryltransferase